MNRRSGPVCAISLSTLFVLGLLMTPVMAHHSFAMYDQTKTVTLTGVLTRFVAQANHAEIHFVPLTPEGKPLRDSEGKPVAWGVEMQGAAAVATQGITVKSFPAGTIFSVRLNPMRDGTNFGSRIGALAKCPKDKVPAAGKYCDSVEGSELLGGTAF